MGRDYHFLWNRCVWCSFVYLYFAPFVAFYYCLVLCCLFDMVFNTWAFGCWFMILSDCRDTRFVVSCFLVFVQCFLLLGIFQLLAMALCSCFRLCCCCVRVMTLVSSSTFLCMVSSSSCICCTFSSNRCC